MTKSVDVFPIDFFVEPDAWVPIEELRQKYHDRNSQVRDEHEMAAIMQSIADEGFTAEMIIVNPWNDKIVSGHGRTEACWLLGYRDKLPVIHKTYASELEHRLAMLRWNRARGHLDIEKEQAELAFLLRTYSSEQIQTALAYTEADLLALVPSLGAVPTIEELAAQYGAPGDRDFWPWINVQVPPEAYALYQSLLGELPGTDDAWKIDQMLRSVDRADL